MSDNGEKRSRWHTVFTDRGPPFKVLLLLTSDVRNVFRINTYVHKEYVKKSIFETDRIHDLSCAGS